MVAFTGEVIGELAEFRVDYFHKRRLAVFGAEFYIAHFEQFEFFALALFIFVAKGGYLPAFRFNPCVGDDDVYLGGKGVAQKGVDIFGVFVSGFDVWLCAFKGLV